MAFREQILTLAAKVPERIGGLQTEEATKHSLVLPFLKELGYNVFDPNEVIPEFVADAGIQRREKVDYAIKKDEEVIMVIECKACQVDLRQKHIAQLARYFTWTDAKIGILTNGVTYRFYADLIKPNKMDPTPFFEFSMLNIQEGHIYELELFTKKLFNPEEILESAMTMVYKKDIQRVMLEELKNPSDEFVKFFLSRIYEGRKTKNALQQFTPLVKQALLQLFSDNKNQELKSLLSTAKENELDQASQQKKPKGELVTTEEELEAYQIVKTIIGEMTDPARVAIRDTLSYCGILLDDNNRKPICRLHFNRTQMYLGLFDEEKQQTTVPIDEVTDIRHYASQLKARVFFIDTGQISHELKVSTAILNQSLNPVPFKHSPTGPTENSILLSKGGNLSISQLAPDLTKIAVGLGWKPQTTGQDIDLDASAFLLGHNGQVLSDHHFIFFNNLTSPDGAVQHLGNNVTGEGEGDDEIINIDLEQVATEVKKIIFTVTIYEAEERAQYFGMIKNAFIRLISRDSSAEIARYDLGQDFSSETALIFGEIYRYKEQWKFKAVGQGFTGGLTTMAKNFGVEI